MADPSYGLQGWQIAIEEQSVLHQKKVDAFWNNIESGAIDVSKICPNASYKDRSITCSISNTGCVCSYYTAEYMGVIMNQNYASCPGYVIALRKQDMPLATGGVFVPKRTETVILSFYRNGSGQETAASISSLRQLVNLVDSQVICGGGQMEVTGALLVTEELGG